MFKKPAAQSRGSIALFPRKILSLAVASVLTGLMATPAHAVDDFTGLGDLAGGSFNSRAIFSRANGVSADGAVVVGVSHSTNGFEAFRWTQAGGMVTVESWLATAGVAITGFTVLSDARGVDASGNTVVGVGTSANGNEAFIARVGASAGASGIVGLTDLGNSIAQTHAISSQIENLTGLAMNGAHHRPLTDIALSDGNNCGWVSGDIGKHWRQADGEVGLGEVGVCHDFNSQGIRVGAGLGGSFANLDLANGGEIHIRGQYGIAEVDWQIPNTQLIASLLGIYGQWDADLTRGYAIAGTQPSKGDTDITAYSLRTRLDWKNAMHLGAVGISPRIAYTVYRSEIDTYQEQGGTAPANFQDQDHTAHELRLGITGQYPLNDKVTLLGHVEAAHRFDKNSARVQGNINALGVSLDVNQQGRSIAQDWVRIGAEVDYKVNASNMINVSSFISSAGQDADMTAAASWKVLF